MSDVIKPPKGVGPHEGRELELLLSGEKPLAMFYDSVPASFDWGEDAFSPHVANGSLIKREFLLRLGAPEVTFRYVFFARPAHVSSISELWDIVESRRPFNEADEIATGRLLGYCEADIKRYLDWALTRRVNL